MKGAVAIHQRFALRGSAENMRRRAPTTTTTTTVRVWNLSAPSVELVLRGDKGTVERWSTVSKDWEENPMFASPQEMLREAN